MENSEKKSNLSARMMLSAAAILAIQAVPAKTFAQTGTQEKTVQRSAMGGTHIHIKIRDTAAKMSIVGFENGTPVFKNAKGEFFTFDSKTGDMNFIKPEEFAKFYCCMKIRPTSREAGSGMATGKRLSHIKMESEITNVSVLGVDQAGNTIQKNSRGETFTLDPVTGDMIFVKL
jgi:hypothetical protein